MAENYLGLFLMMSFVYIRPARPLCFGGKRCTHFLIDCFVIAKCWCLETKHGKIEDIKQKENIKMQL